MTEIRTERLEQYDRLISTVEGIERKGDKMPYTSVNGHMFSFLSESGDLALRLPRDEREAFLERFRTTLQEAHGTFLEEYVTVPAAVLADTALLGPYFRVSYAYVASLKPKPKRRKA